MVQALTEGMYAGSASGGDQEPSTSEPERPCRGGSGEEDLGGASGEEAEDSEAEDSGTSSSSSSSKEDNAEEVQTEEQRRAALKAAIQDARRVLQDKPRKKAKHGFVEDEVCLSRPPNHGRMTCDPCVSLQA